MSSLALAFDILAKDSGASKTFDKVGGASQRAGKLGKAAGLAIAAGLVAAGVAAVKFGKSSVGAFEDTGRQVKGLQRITGGTVEDVSRLTYAVNQSGVGADVFGAAVRKLSSGLLAADKTTTKLVKSQHYEIQSVPKLVKGHIEYVKRLVKVTDVQKVAVKSTNAFGFATRDVAGKLIPTQVALTKLADRFKSMPDGAEKTALAIKLFGRTGTAMLPFLNKGAAGIRELEKQSDRLGHTLTSADLEAIKQNVAAHKQWHAAVSGLQIQVGRLLLPVMAKFATFAVSVLVPIVEKLATFVRTRLAPAFAAFTAGLDGTKGSDYFTRLGTSLAHFRDLVVKVFKEAKTQIEEFFGGLRSPKPLKVTPGVPLHAGPNRDQIEPASATTAGALGVKARAAFEALRTEIENEVVPAVLKLGRNIRDLAVTMAKNLFPILRDVVGKLFDARAVLLPLAAAFIAINAAISVTTTALDAVKSVTDAYTKATEVLTAVKAFFITTTDAETGAITLSTLARARANVVMKAETVYLLGLIAAEKAAAVAAKVWVGVQWLLNTALAANPIGLIVIGIAALVAGFILAYRHSETFRKIVDGAMRGVAAGVDFLKNHWKIFVTAFAFLMGGPVLAGIVLLITHWNKVKAVTASVWNWVSSKVGSVMTFLKNLFLNFTGPGLLIKHFDSIVNTVRGMPGRITKAASGMWDGIKNAFKAAINWIIRGWNSLQFTLPSFDTHIPKVGKVGGFTLGTPDIKPLRLGGRVDPGMPYVVGEYRPELFVPDRGGRVVPQAPAGGGGLTIENLVLQKAEPESNVHALSRGLRNLAFTLGV